MHQSLKGCKACERTGLPAGVKASREKHFLLPCSLHTLKPKVGLPTSEIKRVGCPTSNELIRKNPSQLCPASPVSVIPDIAKLTTKNIRHTMLTRLWGALRKQRSRHSVGGRVHRHSWRVVWWWLLKLQLCTPSVLTCLFPSWRRGHL